MAVDRSDIQYMVRAKSGYGSKVIQHPATKGYLGMTKQDSVQLLDQIKVEEALPFILWNDVWNKYGTYGTRKTGRRSPDSGKTYSKGRKVLVDFGYNIGSEASMKHPAIVVANYGDFLMVVPETGDDGKPFPTDVEKFIIRCQKDTSATIFKKDVVIEIHQLRCISKNRIISDLGVSVASYIVPNDVIDKINKGLPMPILQYGQNLEKVIQAKIGYHYATDIFFQFKVALEEKKALEQDVSDLTEKNQALEEENEKLNKDLDILREQIEQLTETLLNLEQPILGVASDRERE